MTKLKTKNCNKRDIRNLFSDSEVEFIYSDIPDGWQAYGARVYSQSKMNYSFYLFDHPVK